jgi:hypothetical protein
MVMEERWQLEMNSGLDYESIGGIDCSYLPTAACAFCRGCAGRTKRQQQFESTNSHAGKMRRQHVPAILVHDLLLLGRTREQPRVRSQASASQHTASFSFVFVERGIRTRKPKTEEVR